MAEARHQLRKPGPGVVLVKADRRRGNRMPSQKPGRSARVLSGYHGKKTGRGFYDWSAEPPRPNDFLTGAGFAPAKGGKR